MAWSTSPTEINFDDDDGEASDGDAADEDKGVEDEGEGVEDDGEGVEDEDEGSLISIIDCKGAGCCCCRQPFWCVPVPAVQVSLYWI